MYPGLGAQISVREIALDGDGRALDSRAVARLQVRDLGLEAAPLGPSQIKPQQHLGPILCLLASGAGMDRKDRAEAIVLAAEHQAQFLAIELGPRRVDGRGSLARRFRILAAFFLRHLQEYARLIELVAKHLVARELSANLFLLLERGLRGFLTVPEAGLGGLFDELILADGQCGDVKDASRAFRRGRRTRKAAVSCR